MNNTLIPLWTLYIKEVKRFMKVAMQTIIGPAMSSLLFLAVFSLALGKTGKLPVELSVWMPVIVVFIFSSVGLIHVNQK